MARKDTADNHDNDSVTTLLWQSAGRARSAAGDLQRRSHRQTQHGAMAGAFELAPGGMQAIALRLARDKEARGFRRHRAPLCLSLIHI